MSDPRRHHGRRPAPEPAHEPAYAPPRRRPAPRADRGGGDNVVVALLKAAAYSRAPRFTFGVLHPKQAAQLKKLPFDLRTAYAPRITALVVAALALPVGVAIGRALERQARADRSGSGGERAPGRGGAPRPAIRRAAP